MPNMNWKEDLQTTNDVRVSPQYFDTRSQLLQSKVPKLFVSANRFARFYVEFVLSILKCGNFVFEKRIRGGEWSQVV